LPFFAQNRKFNWIDIGSVKDFWSVSQSVMQGGLAQMNIPGIQIEEGLWAGLNTRIDWNGTKIEGPVYIGAGSHIEAGCTIIGPTWIGHGSHICAGAKVVRCVLFEYTRIAPKVHLDEKLYSKITVLTETAICCMFRNWIQKTGVMHEIAEKCGAPMSSQSLKLNQNDCEKEVIRFIFAKVFSHKLK